MKIISVFNQKGGVGKTTTNINLCANLAMKGYRVLALDIDPQGNTTSGLGIDKNRINSSIYDLLLSNVNIEDTIVSYEMINNMSVIPATVALSAADMELANIKDREFVLKRKLEGLEGKFDYIFIDCPPSLGILTVNALVASHSVIIPIQCEFYALEGVGQLISTIQLIKKSLNKNLEIEGVLLSMYDNRTNLSNDVVSEVKKYFKSKVYQTTIPRNIRLAEAPSFGLPILLYDNGCRGSNAYESFTEEFIKRQEVI